MADACPVCSAPFREEPSCYRCKADLTALFELRRGAARLLACARSACRAGDLARTVDLTRSAQALRRTAEGEELELLLLFRTGRPDEAYRRWRARRA